MIGFDILQVGGAIQGRLFRLVQAGSESNLATPAHLDITGLAQRPRSPTVERLDPCGYRHSLQSEPRSTIQR